MTLASTRGEGGTTEATARHALQGLYIHGLDPERARSLMGSESIPVLRTLLFDPAFPRRDNVVMFLGALGDSEAAADLVDFVARSPLFAYTPEEDRALLMAPRALGRIAGRGDRRALDALLALTSAAGPIEPFQGWTDASGSGSSADSGTPRTLDRLGGRAEEAHVAWPLDRGSLRADLQEMAIVGLAFSRAPDARRRLVEVSEGSLQAMSGGRDLAQVGREGLSMIDGVVPHSRLLQTDQSDSQRDAEPTPLPAPGPIGSNRHERPGQGTRCDGCPKPKENWAGRPTLPIPATFDTNPRVHDAGLTFANHPDTPKPMTDERLDQALRLASAKAGREDFQGDFACCTTVSRSGSALTFGQHGDGLETITTATEFDAVLGDTTARAKVVRYIGRCGEEINDFTGCAVGTNSFAVVRQTAGLANESVSWLHEYGHNTGLGDDGPDESYIMFALADGNSGGLTEAECESFHAPAGGGANDVGACVDADGDVVNDVADNCPGLPNPSQMDYDRDGLGDPCDNCFAAANASQSDLNANGRGDACDVTIVDPTEQSSVACDQESAPPSIQWLPGVYDLFRVYVSSDPAFNRPKITSGKGYLRATSWTPSRRKWLGLCGRAGGPIYIQVLGFNSTAPKRDGDRKLLSEIITVQPAGLQK